MVSTNCRSGPGEILQDGALGPLVPVGDEEALADAILGQLEREPERERLRARTRFLALGRGQRLPGASGAGCERLSRLRRGIRPPPELKSRVGYNRLIVRTFVSGGAVELRVPRQG